MLAFAALSSTSAVAASRPLIVSEEGVFAFEPGTLALRWRQLDGQQTLQPVVDGDRVYVTGSRGLYAWLAGW